MSRYLAFFAYLLSVIGALVVLLFRRNDRFAVFHAKQSLGLVLLAIVVFVIWVVVGWLISWIPYVGFVFAIAFFSLVIATYITLFICWIIGMKYALDDNIQPLPIVGGMIQRFFP